MVNYELEVTKRRVPEKNPRFLAWAWVNERQVLRKKNCLGQAKFEVLVRIRVEMFNRYIPFSIDLCCISEE